MAYGAIFNGEKVASVTTFQDKLIIVGEYGTVVVGVWDPATLMFIFRKEATL